MQKHAPEAVDLAKETEATKKAYGLDDKKTADFGTRLLLARRLVEAGVPVVTHCGSGPRPGQFTGPEIVEAVLRRHPALAIVIAHMGSTEYAPHLDLAARYTNVRLDTTMAFTDFTEARSPYPKELLPRLADLGDKILLGTDFPNIPYPYAHQIEALARLDLGDDWLRAVLYHNGAALLGID